MSDKELQIPFLIDLKEVLQKHNVEIEAISPNDEDVTIDFNFDRIVDGKVRSTYIITDLDLVDSKNIDTLIRYERDSL